MDSGINTRKNTMKSISDLGFDIREERCKRNISRIDAAKYCGVSCNAFSMWELGAAKKMSKESFDKLMELLGPDSDCSSETFSKPDGYPLEGAENLKNRLECYEYGFSQKYTAQSKK